ncbi:MAG: DUF2235 domain-containing protein [Thiohalocapsa sp.]|nr:DUF2235 domain-containing protein [Thiohalocapsa sp.]
MRNLVLCCDGTWNTRDQREKGLPAPTNVVKLHNLCIEGDRQRKYYHPGVGTEGTLLRRLFDGGIGRGLDRNIKSAYHWLCRKHRPDDRIFLFGYSRGAYTVRSLGGFILRCGLLDLSGLSPAQGWARVDTAYRRGYRHKQPKQTWGADWPERIDSDGKPPDIHFIGVWDTVGARGVPDDQIFFDLLFDRRRNWIFHDTRLDARVHHAYHAVALDEVRASFAPTLWTLEKPRPEGSSYAQLWFPGCHGNIGGGHLLDGLSDVALDWMVRQAEGQGLRIDERLMGQLRPDPRAPVHESVTGVWRHFRTLPRAVPRIAAPQVNRSLHPAVWQRHGEPPITQAPYRPSVDLVPNEPRAVTVYARERWNETGIWLDASAQYRFAADGEWVDWLIKSGPEGVPERSLRPSHLGYRLGDLLGVLARLYQGLTGKPLAHWWGTKRCPRAPWFALVGMVANQADVNGGGTPPLGEMHVIGAGSDVLFSPERSGYLYCFANDAWAFYGNNRGSVRLTLTRVRTNDG